MSEAARTRAKPAFDQAFETLHVETRGPGLSLVTEAVRGWLEEIAAVDGLLTLFIRDTSASLLIQENADRMCKPTLSMRSSALHRAKPSTCTRPKAPTTCLRTSKRL